MSDDSFFMSDSLEGRVNFDNDTSAAAIEKNTALIVVQCAGVDVVGGLRYFRREGETTAIEVSCSLDSAMKMLGVIESGASEIDVLEVYRGDERVLGDTALGVDGYYISDIEPISGLTLFGLKLSKKRAEVL